MDQGVVFQPDAVSLRQSRKLLSSVLHRRVLDEHQDVLNSHLNQFLNAILNTPEHFLHHIRLQVKSYSSINSVFLISP